MKEAYEAPKMEIVEFETEDIITTSGDGRDPNELPLAPITGYQSGDPIVPIK